MPLVLFNPEWTIDRVLSGTTTPIQSGPGSNGNGGVLRIPQSLSIIETSPSDCLVSYPGHSLGGSYPSAEVQSVYSTAPVDWTSGNLGSESNWLTWHSSGLWLSVRMLRLGKWGETEMIQRLEMVPYEIREILEARRNQDDSMLWDGPLRSLLKVEKWVERQKFHQRFVLWPLCVQDRPSLTLSHSTHTNISCNKRKKK